MKKSFILISAAIIALGVSSCSKEMLEPGTANGQESAKTEKLTLSVSLPEATKTDITADGDNFKLVWNEGDVLYLNGVASDPLAAGDEGASKVAFTWEGVFDYPYNLVYCGKTGSDDAVILPTNQKYNAGGCVDSNATAMYAVVESAQDDIRMNHLNSILRFTLTGSGNVRSVCAQTIGGEKVGGTFTIGKTAGKLDGSFTGGQSDGISLDMGTSGIALGSETPFWLVVPAGTYAGGINVWVTLADNSTMKLTVGKTSGQTFEAGKVYKLASKAFSANCDDIIISTASDFKALAVNESIKSTTVVRMVSDVDMKGVEWTAFDFAGTFEGMGHSILNIQVENAGSATFFNDVTGTINNLTFGSATDNSLFSCTASSGNYRVAPIARVLSGGKLSNITNYSTCTLAGTSGYWVGGICSSYQSALSADDCVNYGLVAMTGLAGTVVNIGGVFGECAGDAAAVNRAINYGEVSIKADGTIGSDKNGLNFGGICGYCSKAVTFTECLNEATGLVKVYDTVTGGGITRIGGILGFNQSAAASFVDCVNKGTVINSGKSFSGKQQGVGGIVGQVNCDSGTASFYGCSGESTADVASTVKATYQFIGGILGRSTTGSTIGSAEKPCTNAGKVRCTGASSNGSANTAPNFGIGGILGAGEDQVDIVSCSNEGAVSNTGVLTYDCNLKCVGGIVGFVAKGGSIVNCTNSGAITQSNGTKLARMHTGGILGFGFSTAMTAFSGNENNGNISVSGSKAFENNIGGIAGCIRSGATAPANNTNNGNIVNTATRAVTDTVKTGTKVVNNSYVIETIAAKLTPGTEAFGGVIGKAATTGTISGCDNTGLVQNNGAAAYYAGIAVGGIVGLQAGANTIDDCENTGEVHHKGSPGAKSTKECAGGIVGMTTAKVTIQNCNNCAKVWRQSGAALAYNYGVGGILGYNTTASTAITNCHNNGTGNDQRTAGESQTTGQAFVGGILGNTDAKLDISGCSNSSVVQVVSTCSYLRMGGIAGNYPNGSTGASFTNCTNTGEVKLTAAASYDARMGGIVGGVYGAFTFTNCTNSGNLLNSASIKDIRMGGILGCNTNDAANITDCTNTGNITNNTTGTLAVCYAGGILGYKSNTKNTVSGCSNTGDISVTSTAITALYAGGITGYNSGASSTITECRSNCSVSNSPAATTQRVGIAFGSTTSAVINKTGIAGSVNGTTLTNSNWTNYLYGLCSTSTEGVNISGDENSCYFLNPGLMSSPKLASSTDNVAW